MISFLYNLCSICMLLTDAWLIMHTMEYLIKIKEGRIMRCLLFFSCLILGGMVIFISDPFNILAALPCFLIAILLACEGSLWKKITIGSIFASTIFSFNAIRDNYLSSLVPVPNLYIYSSQTQSVVFVYEQIYSRRLRLFSSTASLPFAILLYFGIRKFAPDKDYSLSDSLWKLLFLLTATPFSIVLWMTTIHNDRNNDLTSSLFGYPIEYLVLLSVALLSFISLLWCITVLARQQKLEQENMFMEINRNYYEVMEQQHFEIRRLKHDLVNHLQILSALPEDQRDSYLRNLTENSAVTQSLSYCEDTTVNAVLTVKKNLMDRYGIHMESTIDIPAPLPYDKTDVCALYANALDNAVEACMKTDKERRTITLKCKAQKGLFCLEVSNPVAKTDENTDTQETRRDPKPGDIPPTSKTDKVNHGYGLKSIQEIVERYHGSMELKTVNGMFDLFLYIPL